LGTFAASALGQPVFDGIASILIGSVLGVTSLLLARESKSLLIGERADHRLAESILRIAADDKAVASANGVLTIHLAPKQIVAALSLHFVDTLRGPDIEAAVVGIERKLRKAHPEVVTLFVKPESNPIFRESLRRRFGTEPSVAELRDDGSAE